MEPGEPVPQARGKLASIQMLRGFAAVAVVVCHVLWSATGQVEVAASLLDKVLERLGDLGVDLFFCISGFVIALTRPRAGTRVADALTFLRARIWRIYPTYIFWTLAQLGALRLAIAAGFTAVAGFYPWLDFAWFAHNLLLAPGREGYFLTQAWTLLYEMYFYLVFAVVLLVWGRRGAVVPLVGVIGGLFVLFHFVIGQGDRLGWTSARWMLGDPLVWNFVAGAVLAAGFRRWPKVIAGRRALALFAGAGLLVLAALALPETLPRLVRLGLPAAGVLGLLMVAVPPAGRVSRLAVGVGEASYSIYITHGILVVLAPMGAAVVPLPPVLVGLLLSVIAVGLGWLSYTLVEKRLFGRMPGREARPAPAGAVVGPLPGRLVPRASDAG